jgi:hypothetical protein
MARCRQCGASAEAGHRFCGESGCPLEGCPSCGEPVSAGKKFCHPCGFALNSTAPAPAVASRPGTWLPLSAQPAAAAAGAGPGPTLPPRELGECFTQRLVPGQATVPSRHQAIPRPGQLGTPARTGNRRPWTRRPSLERPPMPSETPAPQPMPRCPAPISLGTRSYRPDQPTRRERRTALLRPPGQKNHWNEVIGLG